MCQLWALYVVIKRVFLHLLQIWLELSSHRFDYLKELPGMSFCVRCFQFHTHACQLLLFIHLEHSPQPSLLDIGSYLCILLPSFPHCCKSLIRYPFLFLLRLDASNRFYGYFQQDCLGTLPQIFWSYFILCSLQPLVTSAANCTAFSSLSFSGFRGGMPLCFSQPDFLRCHEQLMVCVAVCSWIHAIIHQACFPSLCNWDVVYLIPGVAIRRGLGIQPPWMLFEYSIGLEPTRAPSRSLQAAHQLHLFLLSHTAKPWIILQTVFFCQLWHWTRPLRAARPPWGLV